MTPLDRAGPKVRGQGALTALRRVAVRLVVQADLVSHGHKAAQYLTNVPGK